jgi:hypothetical protein
MKRLTKPKRTRLTQIIVVLPGVLSIVQAQTNNPTDFEAQNFSDVRQVERSGDVVGTEIVLRIRGVLTSLFQNFYGSDNSRRATYFTGAATIAFQRIYNRIGFICFTIPFNFNGIEKACVHTIPTIRNAR